MFKGKYSINNIEYIQIARDLSQGGLRRGHFSNSFDMGLEQ